MTAQSSRSSASCAHSSRTYGFELYGEKIDPNLSQSHEEDQKEEDHYLCVNSDGNIVRPCNNGRAFSFELFGEKIDPNDEKEKEKEKEKEDDHRVLNGGNGNPHRKSLDHHACNNEPPDFTDSDDGHPNRSSHYYKNKGLPWTRDEHKSFLTGLKIHGRGHWREISERYVQTRTPTQVASHAQKYYLRKEAQEKGKRRSSLFDMPEKSMVYGNSSSKHESSNPKCSTMVPFGPTVSCLNEGRFHPSCSS